MNGAYTTNVPNVHPLMSKSCGRGYLGNTRGIVLYSFHLHICTITWGLSWSGTWRMVCRECGISSLTKALNFVHRKVRPRIQIDWRLCSILRNDASSEELDSWVWTKSGRLIGTLLFMTRLRGRWSCYCERWWWGSRTGNIKLSPVLYYRGMIEIFSTKTTTAANLDCCPVSTMHPARFMRASDSMLWWI